MVIANIKHPPIHCPEKKKRPKRKFSLEDVLRIVILFLESGGDKKALCDSLIKEADCKCKDNDVCCDLLPIVREMNTIMEPLMKEKEAIINGLPILKEMLEIFNPLEWL